MTESDERCRNGSRGTGTTWYRYRTHHGTTLSIPSRVHLPWYHQGIPTRYTHPVYPPVEGGPYPAILPPPSVAIGDTGRYPAAGWLLSSGPFEQGRRGRAVSQGSVQPQCGWAGNDCPDSPDPVKSHSRTVRIAHLRSLPSTRHPREDGTLAVRPPVGTSLSEAGRHALGMSFMEVPGGGGTAVPPPAVHPARPGLPLMLLMPASGGPRRH